jgi:hypothetical protein
MKRLITVFIVLFSAIGISQNATAKNDIIVMTDGKLLQAKVTKVTDEALSFTYPGEIVLNEVRLDKIEKVVFSSGRTQFFGKSSSNKIGTFKEELQPESKSTIPKDDIYLLPAEDAPKKVTFTNNSISLLPIRFSENGNYSEQLSIAATDYTMSIIKQRGPKLGALAIDMKTTVSKLLDNGVKFNELNKIEDDQLHHILGTQYILIIEVNKNIKQSNTTSSWADLKNSTANQNDKDYKIELSLVLLDAQTKTESFQINFNEALSVTDLHKMSNTEALWKSSLSHAVSQLLNSNSLK